MTDRHGERWTIDEMAAPVDAYLGMLHLQNQGSGINRSEVVQELLNGPLEGRTRKSVEFRFCNISSVLSERSQKHLDGYAPLEHVSEAPRAMIVGLLPERDFDL